MVCLNNVCIRAVCFTYLVLRMWVVMESAHIYAACARFVINYQGG